jgi:hypothetical protein
MRRLIMIALILQTAACAGAADPAPDVPAEDVFAEDVPAAPPSASDAIADVLPVSCADGTLTLGAARVRVHADGLHLEVAELADRGISVQLSAAGDPPSHGVASAGSAFNTGITVIDTVAPGTVLVRCNGDDGPRHTLAITDDVEAVSLTIVDDEGHWVQPEGLECNNTNVIRAIPTYGTAAAPPAEPAEPLADAVDMSARAGADVRTYGYPHGLTRWASLVDDGQVVSLGTYERDGTSWRMVGSTACG